MKKTIKYIGLAVHKSQSQLVSLMKVVMERSDIIGKIDNDMNQLDKVISKLISKGAVLKFVYEAGPCGYAIYRYLKNNDTDCVVIAPSKIPLQSGDRLKNDKRDCLSLARLHRAGA